MSGDRDPSLKAALDALKKSARASVAAPEPAAKSAHGHKPDAKSRGGLVEKIVSVLDVFWNDWARPVTRFLSPLTRRLWRFYGWAYETFARPKGDDGARVFSRRRTAVVTLALAVLTLAVPFILARNVIPATARAIYDASMLATMKEDHLFLGRAELINPDRQLYQVMGCRDIKGCDGGDNTTYYRLRDNIILDIKYWTTRFEPYDPAETAGAMVSELNDCKIRYYGRRSKALGWYPYIISASCTPV
jgi:hypothetical protein